MSTERTNVTIGRRVSRVAVRVAVFSVVGVAGTLIINRGRENVPAVVATILIFLFMNIALELVLARKN